MGVEAACVAIDSQMTQFYMGLTAEVGRWPCCYLAQLLRLVEAAARRRGDCSWQICSPMTQSTCPRRWPRSSESGWTSQSSASMQLRASRAARPRPAQKHQQHRARPGAGRLLLLRQV